MILEKVLKWIVVTGVFCLPFVVLIVSSSMFFPFITGKNFAFRIIVEIITGAWLVLALISDTYRPRRSWIVGAFALFVLVMAIADAQGAYPFKSFWSNYERMDGWITLIHTLAYLVVASSVLASEKIWRLLLQLNLGVSVFLSMYGVLQLAGFTALGQGGQAGLATARVDATFGNPIYLAVYMLFNVAIAAILWLQMWHIRPPGKRLAPSLAYGAIIVFDTLALFLTGTRGTMLGLIGGTILAILLVTFLEGSRRMRMVAIASLIGLAIVGGGLRLGKDTTFVRSVASLHRLATISIFDTTVQARFYNMGMAWQGVKERPLLGWGQENYAIVFDKYFDPRMHHAEPWFDRTHNVIFDWLVTGGFLGLITYFSIFAAALWVIWRPSAERGSTEASRLNVRPNILSIPERAIFTGLLAGYTFHNLTVFDNVTSYILFATVLAYIVWREREARKNTPLFTQKFLPQNSVPFVVVIVGIITFTGVWWVNVRSMTANRLLLQAMAPQKEGIVKNLENFKKAIAYGTFGTQEAREQLAQVSVQAAGAQIDDPIKHDFFTTAVGEMELQEQESPLDARFPLFRGSVLQAYGTYDEAAAAFAHAHELSLGKQSILYLMAQNAETRGDHTAALQYLKVAFEVEPSNTEARLYYAAKAIQLKEDALADEILAPAILSGEAANTRIASAYLARGRYDKIATIWEARILVAPQDMQGYFTLAAAYYALGNKAKAIEALQRAKTAIPEVQQQADALILEVQNGTAKLQ
ncbi:MAG: O-antigen ligase family protein [bacterium]|nr:O-antigen ligase family protein [bacterium]